MLAKAPATAPREQHVADRRVGRLEAVGQEPERAIPKGPKGEKTQAVEDHPAYVEITAGPRNGMFINMSNNERHGEAFVLVKRGDRDLHIYGTGKDRRVIIPWTRTSQRTRRRAEGAKPTPATGGAAAPTASAQRTAPGRTRRAAAAVAASTTSATSRAEPGPSEMPHGPWPAATNRPSARAPAEQRPPVGATAAARRRARTRRRAGERRARSARRAPRSAGATPSARAARAGTSSRARRRRRA